MMSFDMQNEQMKKLIAYARFVVANADDIDHVLKNKALSLK